MRKYSDLIKNFPGGKLLTLAMACTAFFQRLGLRLTLAIS
jgi:hypothetical protein